MSDPQKPNPDEKPKEPVTVAQSVTVKVPSGGTAVKAS